MKQTVMIAILIVILAGSVLAAYGPGDASSGGTTSTTTSTSSGGGGGSKNQCRDGIDNDKDGLIDWPDDPGCDTRYDGDETDPAACLEDWVCTSWKPENCTQGQKQTRECGDFGKCGTELFKPATEKDCFAEEPVIEQPPQPPPAPEPVQQQITGAAVAEEKNPKILLHVAVVISALALVTTLVYFKFKTR